VFAAAARFLGRELTRATSGWSANVRQACGAARRLVQLMHKLPDKTVHNSTRMRMWRGVLRHVKSVTNSLKIQDSNTNFKL
jgi:hypothetical protein